MDQIHAVLVALIAAIAILILGGVFSEGVNALVQRRLPNFSYEGETFLLWGAFVIAAFVVGLIVIYLLVRA